MYFTDKETAYTTLVWNVRYMMKSALDSLTGDKNSVTAMANNGKPQNWHSDMGWRVESWMESSHLLGMLDHVAALMADKSQEAYLEVIENLHNDSDADLWNELDSKLEEIAELIRKWMVQEAMRTVYRGVESSSNPMTILNSKAKIDAAKKVIEVLGMSEHSLLSNEAIHDVFDGITRRKAERKELARQKAELTPAKIMVTKNAGSYTLVAVNKLDEQMKTKPLAVTRKGDAVGAAKMWAEDLTNEAMMEAAARGWQMEGYEGFKVGAVEVVA